MNLIIKKLGLIKNFLKPSKWRSVLIGDQCSHDKVAISQDKEALAFYAIMEGFQRPPHGQKCMVQGALVVEHFHL